MGKIMAAKKNLSNRREKPKRNINDKITMSDFSIWIPAAIFVLTTVVFFWDILMQNAFFWEDFIEYVYPVQSFAAVEFSLGTIPFWNPYSFMGMPFLADLQVGFFYPLNRILTLFVSDGELSVWALEFIIILHFFLAQLGMYLLARYLKISSIGSIIAAVSYSFSMLIVCHVIHPMIVYHLAWLPLILMFFMRGLDEGKLSKSIISGLILGLTMLSGHPQMTLYIGFLLGIVFIWTFTANVKAGDIRGKGLIVQIIGGILPILIAAGIFSVQYLPAVKLAEQSQRNEISYDKATEGSLAYKSIYLSVVPGILGKVTGNTDDKASYYDKVNGNLQTHFYWETAYYFGITALLLGLFAAIRKYKTRIAAMLIFIAVVGLLFALGRDGVVFNLMYNLPYFGTFRNPGRIMFFVIISFSLLAGIGFDELWRQIKDKSVNLALIIAGIFPMIIGLLTVTGFLPTALGAPDEIKADIIGQAGIAIFFAIAVFGIAFSINKKFLSPVFGGALLIVIVFVDLSIAGGTFNEGNKNPEEVYKLQPELKKMFVPASEKDLFRVNTRVYKPVSFTAMQRNQGMLDRIHQVEGYNPLVLQKAAIYSIDEKTSFDLSNVKYQVLIDMQKGSWNYAERTSLMPRARMVYQAIVVDEIDAVEYMKKERFDYENTVVLNKAPRNVMPQKIADSIKHNVSFLSYASSELEIAVATEQPGILCLSEIWYPDWKAYVDDAEVEIYQSYNSFRAIEIPKGEHKVRLVYQSEEYKAGSIIALLTIMLSAIAYFLLGRFERKVK